MNVMCHGCGYRFSAPKASGQCPYCGESNKLNEVESAEDLIEDL